MFFVPKNQEEKIRKYESANRPTKTFCGGQSKNSSQKHDSTEARVTQRKHWIAANYVNDTELLSTIKGLRQKVE
jgi:hypothetical protein